MQPRTRTLPAKAGWVGERGAGNLLPAKRFARSCCFARKRPCILYSLLAKQVYRKRWCWVGGRRQGRRGTKGRSGRIEAVKSRGALKQLPAKRLLASLVCFARSKCAKLPLASACNLYRMLELLLAKALALLLASQQPTACEALLR